MTKQSYKMEPAYETGRRQGDPLTVRRDRVRPVGCCELVVSSVTSSSYDELLHVSWQVHTCSYCQCKSSGD